MFVTVYFTNGSTYASPEFASMIACRDYARDNISYTGDKLIKVVITDHYGHEEKVWDAAWDAYSKWIGLNGWRA